MKGWDELREERHAKQIKLGIVDPKWPLTPRPDDSPSWDSRDQEKKERFDKIMATYAAMIECLDHSMGKLVAGLKERGELDNTLILFFSDNGGNAEGGPAGVTIGPGPIGSPFSHTKLGMNWATLANTPFRRYKHFTHEGGISSAFIAHWPAGIPADRRGQIEKQPGHVIDIMATAVDLSGAKYPKKYKDNAIIPMQGVSLRPAFEGKSLNRKQPIFWEHEGNKAMRDGKWKMVQKWRGPWELYDMESDRTELHNVISDHPDIASRMQAAWKKWADTAFVDDWPGPDHQNWGDDINRKKK
jgi:arylsulfatase